MGDVIVNLDIESEWFEIKRIAFREKRKGYGRETMNALIKYAFEEMKMNKVWLEAYTDNEVGRNLYDSPGISYRRNPQTASQDRERYSRSDAVFHAQGRI